VLSGPTQLSFVNKPKSSAFRKELPPPMCHRFRDSNFGFFMDVVGCYNEIGEDAGSNDNDAGMLSSSAVPQVLQPPSSESVLN
jgi:hypothetical protein